MDGKSALIISRVFSVIRKDVLIEAKDRRIAKLEEENLRLRRELDNLRRLLYEAK